MGDPRTDRRTHNPGLRRIDEPLAPSSTSRYPLISGERKWKRSIRWVGATSASARPGCSKLGGPAGMPSLPLGDIWTPSNRLRTTGSKNAMLREHSKTSLWRVMFDGSFMAIPIG
ncbi:MAG: hypothetical protein ACI9CV_001562 [Ilumatobacter sp.]|jgi:hypothetical protein